MDIEKKKAELFAILAELDAEIQTLSDRIAKAREDLANVYTVDDTKRFDENHDLEKGLKHIQLF
jgi:ribosomal protein L29